MNIPKNYLPLILLCTALTAIIVVSVDVSAVTITDGTDYKVINDNNNVDGGLVNVTPSFDAQNRQENETTVAISPIASPVTGNVGDIIAAAANDYRMVPYVGSDVWIPVYVSFNGGATWFLAGSSSPSPNGFNTFVPGFPNDTSDDGLNSPIKNLDAAGDPVIRFDGNGNLYAAGVGFNRNFDQSDKALDTVTFVSRYSYTPGTAGSASTPTSAGEPPHFTYEGTTIVEKGAVGFAVPSPFGFAGTLVDKEWMEVDTRTSGTCSGNIYLTHTPFHGLAGSFGVRFSSSSDGGVTFSKSKPITTGGQTGTIRTQGSDVSVGPDGTIYVVYRTFTQNKIDTSQIQIVKSTDCGKHWSNPVTVGALVATQAPGVAFRTPTFAFVATDSSNSNIVYVAYQNFGTDYDIFVQRSTDGGATWGAPVKVNDDTGARHQIFPTIEVSNGALHVGWYDFRNSTTASNEALDVYYACSNCPGVSYPSFSANHRVSDVSHNGNCLLFGGGTSAFHGDYIELDAQGSTVHVVWADNRNVSDPGTCTTSPFTFNNTGHRNSSVYGDEVTIAP